MGGFQTPHKELLDENKRLRRQAKEAMDIAKKAQEELRYVHAQILLREFLGVDDNSIAFIRALDPHCLHLTDH
jgi:hypothetical protein